MHNTGAVRSALWTRVVPRIVVKHVRLSTRLLLFCCFTLSLVCGTWLWCTGMTMLVFITCLFYIFFYRYHGTPAHSRLMKRTATSYSVPATTAASYWLVLGSSLIESLPSNDERSAYCRTRTNKQHRQKNHHPTHSPW